MKPRQKMRISDGNLSEILDKVRETWTKGLSSKAESILVETLEKYHLTKDKQALLERYLSYTLETQGRYKESFEIIDKYDNEELLNQLDLETQVLVINQLAIGLNNTNEHQQAFELLTYSQNLAEETELSHLFGEIYIGLSKINRKLSEFPLALENAQKALNFYREEANWYGMADSYHTLAISYHMEGNSQKALENYQLAIKIIGENTAPFLLAKIYSDMSGTLWKLRRPQEGIECLEKSIEFFSQTEHKLQTTAAYNNLGINLMMLGEWTRAEQMIQQAANVSKELNHPNLSAILDSLAELKLLRGEVDEAIKSVKEGVKIAEEAKKDWYLIQALRTLARCYLAKGNYEKAVETAERTISICQKMGETPYANMVRLVIAETYLEKDELNECKNYLTVIEDVEAENDFFVMGNIQRIKGLIELKKGNSTQAWHYFSRGLTIFESAGDLYYTALSHFLLGESLAEKQPQKASKHLIKASEIFRKLGVEHFYQKAEEKIENLGTQDIEDAGSTVSSQLLMQRLAEATASRELLFRELTSILQQESKARRIIIAQLNEQNRFYPFITHGYTAAESADLVEKLNIANAQKDLETFSKTKNLSVNPLKTSNAPPAILLLYPRSGKQLLNGSEIKPLLRVVELGMDVCALRENDRVQRNEPEASPFTSQSLMPGFIHSSPAMTELVEEVYKIRSSDVNVLITGESGTGKELVSRAIHTVSNRKDKIFIPFNCTTVPKELAEGHLFGYKKGAYTGASSDSPGVIRSADGGTLFLDEVGDLPLDVQPKLLRFLQEGEVQPLGEKSPIKVDVRIISATNMDLEDQVSKGMFREDLYYRLNVIRLRVPPLRERRSEIEPIVNYYVNHYSTRFHKKGIKIPPQTIDLLMVCNWEGNVRQLCNEIQRIVARAEDGETITPDHLSPELKRSARPIAPVEGSNVKPIMSQIGSVGTYNIGTNGATLEEAVAELEKQMILDSLRRHQGNISQVARELDITRRGLYMKIERYGIDRDKAVA